MNKSKNNILVSICSPVHNEKDNIKQFIERTNRSIRPIYRNNWELVLVDDGSTDSSGEIIKKLRKKYDNIVYLKHKHNMGERAAWATAFKHAKGDLIVILASDLQSHPEDIPKLVNMVHNNKYDVCTAYRKNRKDGVFYWIATRVLNTFMCTIFKLKVADVSSSFFAVKNMYIKNIKLIKNDHRYILAIFRRKGASIKEVDVEHSSRLHGKSHYRKLKVLFAIPELLGFVLRYFRGFYNY
jgi:glycosyltransferase involved in cell wall biosynthesis